MIWNYRLPIIISGLAIILFYNSGYGHAPNDNTSNNAIDGPKEDLAPVFENLKLQIDTDVNVGIWGNIIKTNRLYNVGDRPISIKNIWINDRDDCHILPIYRYESEKVFDENSPNVASFRGFGRISDDDLSSQKAFYGEGITINVGNGSVIEWPASCGKLVNMRVETTNGKTKIDFM